MTAVEPARDTTPVTSAQVKRDRDEVFIEYTKSICPVCKVVVDGQVNIRDGKVYLATNPTATPSPSNSANGCSTCSSPPKGRRRW